MKASKNEEPVINFKGYKITELIYKDKPLNENLKMKEKDLSLKTKFGITNDRSLGMVEQTVYFGNEKKDSFGKITVVGQFEINSKVRSDEEARSFIAQNGSAMLYPYVRTILSVITSLDSPDITLLPSLNFIDAYKKSVIEK